MGDAFFPMENEPGLTAVKGEERIRDIIGPLNTEQGYYADTQLYVGWYGLYVCAKA